MEIEIIRQKRKTLVLNIVDSDHAVVKAPMRMSQKEITDFVESKKNWLKKHSNRLMNCQELQNSFNLNEFIYYDGKPIKRVEELCRDFENKSLTTKKRLVKKAYLEMFDSLVKMAEEISLKTNLKYKKVVPISSVRVWGSFNINQEMKLNYKLVLLPKELAVYVICHELSHGKYLNHKPIFWRQVEKICPNYKILKKKLSDFAFVLKSDFI